MNVLYQDLLNQDINNVKIIAIGKGQYSADNSDWTDDNTMPVVNDPSPNDIWTNWGASQRDLFFLDSNGNYVEDFNITTWDYDAIYNTILGLLTSGCTHPNATNYDETANVDDGSCCVELWGECYNIEGTTELFYINNGLTGLIPSGIGNLVNLTLLDLSLNSLTGEIPSEIGNLTNLNYLYLDNNQLTGEIPIEIGNLTNLTGLILTNNQLTGEIPIEIGSLTNLNQFSVGYNQFTGEIPSEIGNLTNLIWLYLSNNQLTGEIPSEIGNLTNLTALSLGNNQLTGEIPVEICNIGDSSPSLSNNQLCPPYPECLLNQEPFTDENGNGIWDEGEEYFDTNDSGFYEEDYVGYQDTSECINIGDVNGDFEINILDVVTLIDIILMGGEYTEYGDMNDDGGLNILDVVQIVNCILSECWEGEPEPSLCDGLTEVKLWGVDYDIGTTTSISLISQGLSGSIPPEIGCLTSLTHLYLDNNQLTGLIPPEIGNLTNLIHLTLQTNQLTGEIPPEIGNLTNLTKLRLFGNQLTGEIPPEIGNLINLTNLWLWGNQLTGEIPQAVCDLIESNNLDINDILAGNNLIDTCE